MKMLQIITMHNFGIIFMKSRQNLLRSMVKIKNHESYCTCKNVCRSQRNWVLNSVNDQYLQGERKVWQDTLSDH